MDDDRDVGERPTAADDEELPKLAARSALTALTSEAATELGEPDAARDDSAAATGASPVQASNGSTARTASDLIQPPKSSSMMCSRSTPRSWSILMTAVFIMGGPHR